MKDKTQAIHDWMAMTSQSWSYNALSDEQRDRWHKTLKKQWVTDSIKGTYKERWNALQAIYFAFLEGVGIK